MAAESMQAILGIEDYRRSPQPWAWKAEPDKCLAYGFYD